MLKEVVGSIMAGFVGVVLLSVILPVLKNVQNMVFDSINATDAATIQLMALGEVIYFVLGFIVFFVTGFIILSYAIRRDPYDVS